MQKPSVRRIDRLSDSLCDVRKFREGLAKGIRSFEAEVGFNSHRQPRDKSFAQLASEFANALAVEKRRN